MWTFETKYLGSDWLRSGQRFQIETDAITAACDWVKVTLENGGSCSVRVVKL